MMLEVEEAAAATAIDPLISLLVGALGAALIGLLGAWIQSRREHSKWLRERRYEAYRAFMIDMDGFRNVARTEVTVFNATRVRSRADALQGNFSPSYEAVSLLGPKRVNAAGQAWVWALMVLANDKNDSNAEAYSKARWHFLIAAGKTLKSANVGIDPIAKPMPVN